ncbi:biosynthetic-type acetolactate synthase large subunit [Gracilibacillus oryzae]|uniref:Acetolactate synthase n=1 Tax=Gracilibacillus oryzae TaxID=1672701 RepID=A0A7C8GQ42_9BACI|nr:biosynthetic-type acetolactate synthase large subunit [Gracilibacillus oryzae]KAB8125891.1 biosynthetic-type acetolactate synthase large subunit [Gracilibacillus oryzae]
MHQTQKTMLFPSAKLLVKALEDEKTDTLFGSVFQLPFLQPKQAKLIQLTHEQSIIHAADGYARATGKPGIAFITTEYGLTNAVTGIATAQIDSIPLVIFIQKSRKYAAQMDIESITKPVSKYQYTINRPADIPTIVARAVNTSLANRPGVVIVDFDESVLNCESELSEPFSILSATQNNVEKIPEKQILKIFHVMEKAERPVLIIGGGVIASGASNELLDFIKKTKIPFTFTLMGLGAIDSDHPSNLGMLGMHGTFAANRAVHRADLLICLGVRFSDRITGRTNGFSPNLRKIQVEIDPAEVNKNISVDFPIICDIKEFLIHINPLLEDYKSLQWCEEVNNWRKNSPQFSNSASMLKPDHIIRQLHKHAPEDVIIATDVGQHQMWTALHYPFHLPRHFLTSGGFGTMGFGLPAAIGGAVSQPDQPVICVTGDGSIQMNIQELFHVAKYNLNIKIAILRNGYLGMVRQWQQLFFKNKYSQVKITSPDFIRFAQSIGMSAYKATTNKEAEYIIQKAFEIQGPVLLDFIIEEEVNVFPIVPPGGNNTDAIQHEKDDF